MAVENEEVVVRQRFGFGFWTVEKMAVLLSSRIAGLVGRRLHELIVDHSAVTGKVPLLTVTPRGTICEDDLHIHGF